jgi:hypothetical protein
MTLATNAERRLLCDGNEHMCAPVHPELFELAFRIHEPAGGIVDVGAKLCCIQLSLSSAQHAQPVLDLLLLGQGLSTSGVGGGAGPCRGRLLR